MGDRRPPHFTEPRPPQVDEWDAKGLAERIVAVAYPSEMASVEPSADPSALWEIVGAADDRGSAGNGARPVLGHVRRVALDAPVWAAPAFGVELTLETLDSSDVAPPGRSAWREQPPAPTVRHIVARDLPQFPAAEFDLALLVPNDVPAARVESVMRSQAGELLERLSLFDEYRGGGIPAGHRSLAWRLTFRHPERTLRDKEVEARRERLVRALESELGIRARTS
jgi:phenylalanyl-tRNA synthetase beta chain